MALVRLDADLVAGFEGGRNTLRAMAPTAFELPAIGSTFAGQFEVLELIGQGGMGVVYRARQLKLQREVALKVLRPSAVADGYEQFRLEREAVSAARFRSQHVVDIYDWGVSADGLTYLVMELLQGETLAQRLDRQGSIDPAQVATWLRQCSEALDEASALGIVHRDIKPANLFLATTPSANTTEIKILDFGITKVFDPTRATFRHEVTTQSSLRLGTTRYMSPEQLRATSTVDARADLWSLGVVIYQALSGIYPFDRTSEADLIVSILSDEPRPLHLVDTKLSRALADTVARALEKNADCRYRSAGEFSRALTAALGPHSNRLIADPPDSKRPAPTPAAQLLRGGEATNMGLETRASNDSARVEYTRPQSGRTKLLAIVGLAFVVSSAVVFSATGLFPRMSRSEARPLARAIPRQQAADGEAQRSAHGGSAPLPSPSGTSPAMAQSPLPKAARSGTPRAQSPRRSVATPRSSASALGSARSVIPADQFERDNPYAN